MDYESMNLVKEKLNLISPIGEYPFYLFVETFGSNQQHDEQKLMQFLDFTLKKHSVLNGTLINDSKRYEVNRYSILKLIDMYEEYCCFNR